MSGKWRCTECDYVYNPELGEEDGDIPIGTKFKNIQEKWKCPLCGSSKNGFKKFTDYSV